MENGGGVGFDYTQKILIEMGGEYSSVFTPDKRDIQKDDMGEYQDTCHEENLLACREREREGGRESAQKVWVGGLYETTDFSF